MDTTILGIAGALIGAFGGVYLGYRLNKKAAIETIKTHEFVKSGNRFKSIFAKTIELIDTSNLTWGPIQQLKTELPILEKAVMEFQVYLSDSWRDELRKAWKKYRREDDDEFAGQYTILDQDVKNESLVEYKRQFIKCRINKIHKYTDPKFVFNLKDALQKP